MVLKDFRTECGSRHGQNLALTGFFVPSVLDSGTLQVDVSHLPWVGWTGKGHVTDRYSGGNVTSARTNLDTGVKLRFKARPREPREAARGRL